MPGDTIGERIRTYRRRKGLKQSELAEMLGLKRASITNYELNRHKPPKKRMILLAKFLDVTIEDLVQDPRQQVEYQPGIIVRGKEDRGDELYLPAYDPGGVYAYYSATYATIITGKKIEASIFAALTDEAKYITLLAITDATNSKPKTRGELELALVNYRQSEVHNIQPL